MQVAGYLLVSWYESDSSRFGQDIPSPKIKQTKVRDALSHSGWLLPDKNKDKNNESNNHKDDHNKDNHN